MSPSQLVRRAAELPLTAVALTDHDTVTGVPEFLSAARGSSVQAVPGVEVGCSWYGGSLHILGLFIDVDDVQLNALLSRVREARGRRNRHIVERLQELGFGIDWDDVLAQAVGESVGRPHIAGALVKRGVCGSIKEVFSRLLGEGKPACVRRFMPLPAETIGAVHAAGGVAVWAHPVGLRQRTPSNLRRIARHLKGVGVDAMEGYYSEYSAEQQRTVHSVARELGLLISGGSDYHGETLPGISLGRGHGNLAVPDDCLVPLAARAAHWRAARRRRA